MFDEGSIAVHVPLDAGAAHPDAMAKLGITRSFVEALAEGCVWGSGDDTRFTDSELGPTSVHALSMRIAWSRFTRGASR